MAAVVCDAAPLPAALTARTSKQYVVPAVRPVIVIWSVSTVAQFVQVDPQA